MTLLIYYRKKLKLPLCFLPFSAPLGAVESSLRNSSIVRILAPGFVLHVLYCDCGCHDEVYKVGKYALVFMIGAAVGVAVI
jgi:hypothetical protein